MEEEIRSLTRVWIAVTVSLCYCYFISVRFSKGKWRLISLFPIFSLYTILPIYLTSAFFRAVVALFMTWLANFKLLLFAFDQGPLSSSEIPSSLPVFIAIAALPFKIKPKIDGPSPNKSKKLPLNLATEIPITAVMIQILYEYREYLHDYVVLAAYCCLVFLLVDILVASSSFVAHALFGLELEPPSDEPYLSTSLRDFWGRRWNLTVNGLLRQTIYKPVRAAASKVVGRDWAALPAVMAAFLVSGLMHELIFWYVTPGKPSWEMTVFFVVQGVGVVVEFGLKVAFGEKRRRLPWFVSGPISLGFVVGTSFWLFFPPLMRNGADVRVIEEFRFAGEIVKEKLKDLWLQMGRELG